MELCGWFHSASSGNGLFIHNHKTGAPYSLGYVDAIREVAAYYSLPVLDLYRVSGMATHLETQKIQFMPDGIHPNVQGHIRIAERLQSFLQSL